VIILLKFIPDTPLLHIYNLALQQESYFSFCCSVQNIIYAMSPSSYPNIKKLVPSVEKFAQEWMDRNDGTHDYSHVHRVALRALTIAREESKIDPTVSYDEDLIYVAALLHDITDRKYVKGGMPSLLKNHSFTPKTLKEHLIDTLGIEDEELLEAIDQIANNVSWSTENSKPDQIAAALKRYPELAVVQDADRIDSVGGIGIARVFAFGNVVETKDGLGRPLVDTLDHFDEKLFHLENYAKTQTGKKMLKEATRRMHVFKEWFDEELAVEKVF
jgi:uncharacterized protein